MLIIDRSSIRLIEVGSALGRRFGFGFGFPFPFPFRVLALLSFPFPLIIDPGPGLEQGYGVSSARDHASDTDFKVVAGMVIGG